MVVSGECCNAKAGPPGPPGGLTRSSEKQVINKILNILEEKIASSWPIDIGSGVTENSDRDRHGSEIGTLLGKENIKI